MSKTPRTDALIPSQSFVDQTRLFDREWFIPLLDHARQLERELAAETSRRKAAEAALLDVSPFFSAKAYRAWLDNHAAAIALAKEPA